MLSTRRVISQYPSSNVDIRRDGLEKLDCVAAYLSFPSCLLLYNKIHNNFPVAAHLHRAELQLLRLCVCPCAELQLLRLLRLLPQSMAALTNTTGVDASMIRERYPSVSMPSQVPDVLSQTENLGKSTPREPRFMSPTVSSTKQTTVKASKHGNSTTIPSASSSKHSGSGNWMSLAAKRVGLGRTGDGHPRSKKEGRSKQPMKAVSFPDKV